MPDRPTDRPDVRRRPKRGVSIKPLPQHMHQKFIELCDALRMHAQSHKSTWHLAHREVPNDVVQSMLMYWDNVHSYINTLEYLGTRGNDPNSDRSRHRTLRKRSR